MRRDRLLIAEMIDSCRRVLALAEQFNDSDGDPVHLEAVLWNFTVLGEACSQVSDGLKQEASDVDWQNPVRLRNRSSTDTDRSTIRCSGDR